MAEYKGMKMAIEWETRLCEVDGELGYFHTWEQYAEVISPGLMIGSHPGGQFSRVYGIVEFKDRVGRVTPSKIKFCDDENAVLNEMAKHNERRNNDVSDS